jgi:hypothetical protein
MWFHDAFLIESATYPKRPPPRLLTDGTTTIDDGRLKHYSVTELASLIETLDGKLPRGIDNNHHK